MSIILIGNKTDLKDKLFINLIQGGRSLQKKEKDLLKRMDYLLLRPQLRPLTM